MLVEPVGENLRCVPVWSIRHAAGQRIEFAVP